jgi:O-antigen/teichoic acid export membrane protein
MIWVVSYVVVAFIVAFIMIAYNEATIRNKSKRNEDNVDALSMAILWPLPLFVLVIIAPFWAVSSLAKWFGRNYL